MDRIETLHRLILGDARDLGEVADQSVHLVVTSPPYWKLKRYNENENQLGHMEDYEEFLNELGKVWAESFRVLIPGGRIVCVIGDVCMSRRRHGRHVVMPLHSDICVQCRKIGFDNLNPIIWHKIANATYEVEGNGGFLGKPYEPNGIIKNDIEFILMQRKPGAYRKPSSLQRELSRIPKDQYSKWFSQIWRVGGASTKQHPAPFPLEVANRLVRMFSFVGDVVLDPFWGSGTTSVAALRANRSSIGIEIDPDYYEAASKRLLSENLSLLSTAELVFEKSEITPDTY